MYVHMTGFVLYFLSTSLITKMPVRSQLPCYQCKSADGFTIALLEGVLYQYQERDPLLACARPSCAGMRTKLPSCRPQVPVPLGSGHPILIRVLPSQHRIRIRVNAQSTSPDPDSTHSPHIDCKPHPVRVISPPAETAMVNPGPPRQVVVHHEHHSWWFAQSDVAHEPGHPA
jgi:hypothetical protein